MKRLFLALTLLTIISTGNVLANEHYSYPGFLKSFFKTFSKAENVSWDKVDGLTRIEFKVDGKIKFAYYNEDNNLLVVTSPINLEDIPLALQSKLAIQYKNYKVSGVYECWIGKQKAIYVVLDNSKKQLVVKARGKKWNTFISNIK